MKGQKSSWRKIKICRRQDSKLYRNVLNLKPDTEKRREKGS